MTEPTHLRSLQALDLAIRKGSLKAAAAELSITPAALGQRIKSLEEYLGYELISRGRSGIRPSREIQPALAHLGAAFRELETVSRLLNFQRVNEIHITADSDWAQLWLAPRLVAYRGANPNTLFCVNGVGDVPMRLGDADCEVGFSVDALPGKVDSLYRDYLVPITSPVNKERVSSLPLNEELEGFPLLHLDAYTVDASEMGWPEWVRRFGHRTSDPERGIRYKKVVQALEAVYANAGFILCGVSLVFPQIREQRLSVPFPIEQGDHAKREYHVRFRSDSLKRNAVKSFREWLLEQARSTRAEIDRMVG
ncbi:MAG: LysR family transcriptional regulator [Pseudomonadota bacterium]